MPCDHRVSCTLCAVTETTSSSFNNQSMLWFPLSILRALACKIRVTMVLVSQGSTDHAAAIPSAAAIRVFSCCPSSFFLIVTKRHFLTIEGDFCFFIFPSLLSSFQVLEVVFRDLVKIHKEEWFLALSTDKSDSPQSTLGDSICVH